MSDPFWGGGGPAPLHNASPGHVRGTGLVLGVGAWTVLGVARWLVPSPAGVGTHQQLGLAPCTLLSLTGWPCPMCGMTTTFALLAHGRWAEATCNQPFGVVLFLATAVLALAGTVDAMFRAGWIDRIRTVLVRHEHRVSIVFLVGLGAGWIWKAVVVHPEVFGLAGVAGHG